jgi:hypothetical protein
MDAKAYFWVSGHATFFDEFGKRMQHLSSLGYSGVHQFIKE